MSYTQAELNAVWHKLKNEPGESGPLDVASVMGRHSLTFLIATIVADADTEQAIVFPGSVGAVTSYTDFDLPSGNTTGTYVRLREGKEEEWGAWEKMSEYLQRTGESGWPVLGLQRADQT